MEKDRFEALIARMERLAIEQPAAYRRRVYGFAALGYAYLVFVMLLLLVLLSITLISLGALKALALKLIFVEVALLYAIIRSLWVKQESPQGQIVTAADAPELFETIHGLQCKLQTPTIDAVLLVPQFNAAIAQVPRLGIFGWHKNYLLLGLPLMKGLTVEQFKAVLAHELGHLSRGHARVANRIYRMRMVWTQLESTFARKRHWGSALILRFFKWYVPYFNAISFPFARANEYEADAASVKLTSPRDAAQALTSVHIIAGYLAQSYWPGIHASAKERPEAPLTAFSGFAAHEINDAPKDSLDRWYNAAVSETTSYVDTHPSLSDRLRSMGESAAFVLPSKNQSADRLMGSSLKRIEEVFDRQWYDSMSAKWREYYDAVQAKRARLSQLREKPWSEVPDENLLLEMAALEEEVGAGVATALPFLREVLTKFPESKRARFTLARVLLTDGQGEGVALMEGVIADDPSALLPGSTLLRDYYFNRGDRSDAARWQDCYVTEATRLQREQAERRQIRLKDRFAPSELESETRSTLVASLRRIKHLRHAYLVRKVDQKRPGDALYVLGFRCTRFFETSQRKAREAGGCGSSEGRQVPGANRDTECRRQHVQVRTENASSEASEAFLADIPRFSAPQAQFIWNHGREIFSAAIPGRA